MQINGWTNLTDIRLNTTKGLWKICLLSCASSLVQILLFGQLTPAFQIALSESSHNTSYMQRPKQPVPRISAKPDTDEEKLISTEERFHWPLGARSWNLKPTHKLGGNLGFCSQLDFSMVHIGGCHFPKVRWEHLCSANTFNRAPPRFRYLLAHIRVVYVLLNGTMFQFSFP